MRRLLSLSLFAAGLAALVPLSFGSSGGEPPPEARAVLRNAEGEEVGVVRFKETAAGVQLSVRIDGLPPGIRALHIHEAGSCRPPGFESAGGHFNPTGARHGFLNPEGPHAGDLPNFTVEEDGTAEFTITTGRVTLREGEKNSLFPEGGTSLVVHLDPDDYLTDPAGRAGERIACGVIESIVGDED